MNKYTKMMLMNNRDKNRENDRERRESDREYKDMPENKFRDRRGREHYEDGRYSPQSEHAPHSEYGYGTEREYEPARMAYAPPYTPYTKPMHNDTTRAINKIGFVGDGEVSRAPEWDHNYRSDAEYKPVSEMGYRHGGEQQRGHYANKEGMHSMKMDRQMAEQWAAGMVNTDNTTGPHWTREQVKQVMDQHGINADLDEFWVVLNGIYSDYCGAAKKHNVNKMEFYIDMAKAWLYDADAVEDKTEAYYNYVVKH